MINTAVMSINDHKPHFRTICKKLINYLVVVRIMIISVAH